MTFLADPVSAAAGAAGGKARALARLAGVHPIPAWTALTPAAFDASLSPERRAALARGDADAALAGLAPAPGVVTELVRALLDLGAREAGVLFAVRSSALDEDGDEHSFAGQLASFLNVPAAEVPARVVDVWRSGLGGHVLAYRRARGLPPPAAPGVIVQRMVPADRAGVAFGADPVTGERDVVVVSAVAGLGEALVGGEASGETWRVRGGAAEGADIDGADIEGESPLLSPAELRAVADLARRCGAHFGAPQDVEWAFHAGALHLLQSRPITTLPPPPDVASAGRTWWDNSNIVESYSGVTTPLTFSFAHRAYSSVYRHFCRLLGVPQRVIDREGANFDAMIGLVRGRVYYNLSAWYRTLALLPGFSVNRRFMEQMMGVAEGMPADLRVEVSRSPAKDALYLARTAAGLVYALVRLPGLRDGFRRRLADVLAEPAPPLAERSLSDLAAHYRHLEAQLLGRWDAPLVNDFFAMIFYGVLRRLTQQWVGDAAGTLQNDLIVGGGGMISAEPAERLARLARLARPHPDLVETLAGDDLGAIERALARHPELDREGNAYLAKFGDRCLDELKLESPVLTDDPRALWRGVAQIARAPEAPENDSGAARERAEKEVLSRLPWTRRGLYRWVLREARGRVRDRENLRFERTRVFGRARRIFREMGRRLHEAGKLDAPDDVYYLETREVLGYVEGTATTADIAALARLRRAEFEGHRAAPPLPRRFSTRGALPLSPLESARTGGDLPDDVREGLGCSPGIVSGPVRVVRDPRDAELREPVILVAERTDPGWILVLPLARALLVERGSLLSHSAIVSRELGIPAVVAVPGLTDWLRDGDEVELNGTTGTVRLLRRAEPPGAEPGDGGGEDDREAALVPPAPRRTDD